MAPEISTAGGIAARDEQRSLSGALDAKLRIHQRAPEMQAYNQLIAVPIALAEKVRADSVAALNQVLADTMTLRDLYKKHHWQTSGATFYQLHLLYDKHWNEQV